MNRQRLSLWCCAVAAFGPALFPPVAQAGEKHRCAEEVGHCVRAMAGKAGNRGWVGIEMDRSGEQRYLVIQRVIPNSPAEASGLRPGDELVGLNGIDYLESNQEKVAAEYRREMIPGNTITYTIVRDGQRRDVRIKLAKIPEAVLAQWIGNHVLRFHQVGDPVDPPRRAEAKP